MTLPARGEVTADVSELERRRKEEIRLWREASAVAQVDRQLRLQQFGSETPGPGDFDIP